MIDRYTLFQSRFLRSSLHRKLQRSEHRHPINPPLSPPNPNPPKETKVQNLPKKTMPLPSPTTLLNPSHFSKVLTKFYPPFQTTQTRTIQVKVRRFGEYAPEQALSQLKRALVSEGILTKLKAKEFYRRPSLIKTFKKEAIVRLEGKRKVNRLKEWIDYERGR